MTEVTAEVVSEAPEAAEAAPAAKPARKAKTISIRIDYDYWDANEERHAAGSVIELPEKEAAEMVNIGKAKLVVGE